MSTRKLRASLGALVILLLVAGAAAIASPSLTIVTSTPKSADQISNIDVVRQQIKNYYGDAKGTGVFAADSNYAQEAQKVASEGGNWLNARAGKSSKPAIILDVDDTTLATYNYEIASNWAFNPTTNDQFVRALAFPAVPGMVDLANEAKAEGYALIFLTGRGAAQEQATLDNLAKDGYPAPTPIPGAAGNGDNGLFTKPVIADYPAYLKWCNAPLPTNSCNTDEYKSSTREYIESLGYTIVANFGDQFSDFSGGFEDRTFKLPNPSYFLP